MENGDPLDGFFYTTHTLMICLFLVALANDNFGCSLILSFPGHILSLSLSLSLSLNYTLFYLFFSLSGYMNFTIDYANSTSFE